MGRGRGDVRARGGGGQGRLKGGGASRWCCTETPLSTDPGVTAPRGGAESLPRRVGVSHPGSAGASRVPHRRGLPAPSGLPCAPSVGRGQPVTEERSSGGSCVGGCPGNVTFSHPTEE